MTTRDTPHLCDLFCRASHSPACDPEPAKAVEMGSTPSPRCSPDFAHALPVERKKPCETSLVLSLRIPDTPCPLRADSFVQTLGDCGLGDISSSPLQLPRRPVTDMPTV